MSREVRFTLEDDQFARLDKLKDRHGYTWKGMMLEGAHCLSSESAEFPDRDRLQTKVASLKEEFGDREHHSTFGVSLIEAESGEEFLGIHVMLMDMDHMRLVSDLEDIDRSIYEEGYNTAWVYEGLRRSDEAFIPEGDYLYEGAVNALLIERGTPTIPDIQDPHGRARSHQNVH